jgi:hypothetical protein
VHTTRANIRRLELVYAIPCTCAMNLLYLVTMLFRT